MSSDKNYFIKIISLGKRGKGLGNFSDASFPALNIKAIPVHKKRGARLGFGPCLVADALLWDSIFSFPSLKILLSIEAERLMLLYS